MGTGLGLSLDYAELCTIWTICIIIFQFPKSRYVLVVAFM